MRKIAAVLLVTLLATPAAVQAGPILQPAGASTNMGSLVSSPTSTIDKSGLSAGYTSLVTDFDTYIAGNPTHESGPVTNIWVSRVGPPGNFDFDLGGSFTIESFALWNAGFNINTNIVDFQLLADDNAAFSSPVLLGDFSADAGAANLSMAFAQVFTFASTEASFVRLRILSNLQPTEPTVVFGEAAFEVQEQQVVPEPSSLAIFATILVLLASVGLLMRRRKLATATVA